MMAGAYALHVARSVSKSMIKLYWLIIRCIASGVNVIIWSVGNLNNGTEMVLKNHSNSLNRAKISRFLGKIIEKQ